MYSLKIAKIQIFSLLICACFPINAYANNMNRKIEITTQIFAGYFIGAAAGMATGIATNALGVCIVKNIYGTPSTGSIENDFLTGYAAFALGATPAMILASSASVYIIGQISRNGSFRRTLLGASVPPLIGAIALPIMLYHPTPNIDILGDLYLVIYGSCLGSFLSPVGAIIAYQLSAKSKMSDITIPIIRKEF